MKKFFKDFKAFISRGNVIDLAVGVIIGGAFTAIVTALTNKILMPVINWILLAIVGGNGMESIYTFLKKAYVLDELGNPTTTVDLSNSIYIDWGAFIIAIIDFVLIALVLFCIIRVIMRAKDVAQKEKAGRPTRAELAELKEKGVEVKSRRVARVKVAELRAEKKAKEEAEAKAKAEAEKKPTEEELLTEILIELKKLNKK